MLAIFTGKSVLLLSQIRTVKNLVVRKITSHHPVYRTACFYSFRDICRYTMNLAMVSIFSLILLCQFICSCSTEPDEIFSKGQHDVENANCSDNEFTCRLSDWDQSTKVELGDWKSVSNCPVLWNSGDRIAILCDDNTRSSYITENDKMQEARFRFNDNLPDNKRLSVSEKYIGLYPEDAWSSDGALLIPSTQSYTMTTYESFSGKTDSDWADSNEAYSWNKIFFPMIAYGDKTRTLEFSGVCGILRLNCRTATGNATDVTITEVAIYANQKIGNVRMLYSEMCNDDIERTKRDNENTESSELVRKIKEGSELDNERLERADKNTGKTGSICEQAAQDAEATNMIELKLSEAITLTEDGTDFLFTVPPGEYTGLKFQLTLSDGRFLICPVSGGIRICRNVMNSFTLPIEAFFLSDKSVEELVATDNRLVSLEYTFGLSESETTASSGKFYVSSYRSYVFSDGSEWISDIDMDASFSIDGGTTFRETIPSILSEFVIDKTSDTKSSVTYTLSDEADSCIVCLQQSLSGKKLNVVLK